MPKKAPKSNRQQPATRKNALTDLDRAILGQLATDPLASNRAVAEALGIPANQVAARIRWLDRQDVSRVIAVLNLTAAGQTFCFVQIDVRGRPIDEVATEISTIRTTLTVSALSGGTHDLLVLLRFHDTAELKDLIFTTLYKIPGVFHVSVAVVIDVPVFNPNYVTYMPHFLPLDVEANIKDIAIDYDESTIDSMDRSIIAELQQDGRKSINDIARRYDINSSTIRYRVKNLENKGLMRFLTVFDPEVLGITAFALLQIQVAASHIDSVIQTLDDKGWLYQIFVCSGSAALIGIMQAESLEAIQRIKSEGITDLDGVIDVNVTPIIHTYKMDLRWGQQFKSSRI